MRFKIIIATSLTIIAMALTSCKSSHPFIFRNGSLPNVIDVNSSELDDLTVSLTPSTLANMIDKKETIFIYFGDHLCSSCLLFEEVLINYISETRILIYHYDTFTYYQEYATLKNNYPNVFTFDISTPMLVIINEGTLYARRESHSSMYDLSSFRSIMRSYINLGNVIFIYDNDHIMNRIDSKTLIYFYDRDNDASNDLWVNHLSPHLTNQNKPFYLFDLSLVEQSALSVLNDIYGYEGQSGYIVKIDDNDILDTISLSSDIQTIVDWVTLNLS
jgi:predicted bacteriocin transport accessory protein